MKITHKKLKQIINEEIYNELNESPALVVAEVGKLLLEIKPYLEAILKILPLIPEDTKKSVVTTLIKGLSNHPVLAAASPIGFGPIINFLVAKIIQSKVKDENGEIDDNKISSLADSIIGSAESILNKSSEEVATLEDDPYED
tara:strand:+ start:768 stop:1196 length:429 start_codon:yes stop_codon:yes gene_type:complete